MHSRFDGRIFQKECRSLNINGFDVSLIVADGLGDEKIQGIKIFDVGKIHNRFQRITRLHTIIFKLAITLNCEIYHFHDPELIFVGILLKRHGKKVIFDMHEDIPGYILDMQNIQPALLRKTIAFLYENIEKYAVTRFDAIISTRESINERLKHINSHVELITNFPIVEKNIPKTYDNVSSICFAGVVASDWRHKEIINAVEGIEQVKYILAGPAPNLNYLDELKKLKGWHKVNYLGRVPFDQVKLIYQKASIGVAIYIYCRNMGGKTGNLANTKLFEYMNWGIPIICTDYSLWKKIIVDELKCGICVNPYDEDAISKAIKYLLDNPELAKQMGRNGRKAVLNTYNWETQAKKLVTLYSQVKN